jgi:hypothetical protein
MRRTRGEIGRFFLLALALLAARACAVPVFFAGLLSPAVVFDLVVLDLVVLDLVVVLGLGAPDFVAGDAASGA